MRLLWCFRCWRFYRSYPRKGSHHFIMILFSFASYWYFSQDCVSPCHYLSNKLGFVEFGARMRKLWLFWYCMFYTERLYRPMERLYRLTGTTGVWSGCTAPELVRRLYRSCTALPPDWSLLWCGCWAVVGRLYRLLPVTGCTGAHRGCTAPMLFCT